MSTAQLYVSKYSNAACAFFAFPFLPFSLIPTFPGIVVIYKDSADVKIGYRTIAIYLKVCLMSTKLRILQNEKVSSISLFHC